MDLFEQNECILDDINQQDYCKSIFKDLYSNKIFEFGAFYVVKSVCSRSYARSSTVLLSITLRPHSHTLSFQSMESCRKLSEH